MRFALSRPTPMRWRSGALNAFAHGAGSWLTAALLLFAFAVPGSDKPASACFLVMLFALATIVIWLQTVRNPPFPVLGKPIKRLLIALLLLMGALLLAPLRNLIAGAAVTLVDPTGYIVSLIKLGGIICAFAIGYRLTLLERNSRKLTNAILIVGGFWAVVAIGMHIADPAGTYGLKKFAPGRLSAAFSSSNSAGTLFGALSVMALGRLLGVYLKTRSAAMLERINLRYFAILIVSFAALSLTLSRTALVVTLVTMVVITVAHLRRKLPIGWLILGGSVTVLTLAFVFAPAFISILGRFDNVEGDMHIRTTIYAAHFNAAIKQPLFGAGLGAFNTLNEALVTRENYQDLSMIGSAHNVYLQWFEEAGFLGLAALANLNLAILQPMIAAIRGRSMYSSHLWTTICAYLVFLLHGFTDYAFQEPVLTVFISLVLGSGFCIALKPQSTKLAYISSGGPDKDRPIRRVKIRRRKTSRKRSVRASPTRLY